ncbi:MAG: rhodanese-like domain-containing protein [Vagococcus salmoninarum]|uniref:rhodanese-like domain-containing protein n=1 Tax=Vagococcus salmoninarum TaxID=2739 RepID=UPI003F98CD84
MSNTTNRLNYLQAVMDSQLSPTDIMMAESQHPGKFFHVDVRIAPSKMKGQKVIGALEIPLNELPTRLDELPKDKTIIVSTWGATCSLAKSASIILIQAGFDVLELSGGVALWQEFEFPTEDSTYL